MSSGEFGSNIGSAPPGSPVSLKSPKAEDAADRRLFKGETASNTDPPAEGQHGIPTHNRELLIVSTNILDAGKQIEFLVWVRYHFDGGIWHPRLDVGNSGVFTVAEDDSEHPTISVPPIELYGADEVFIEIQSNDADTVGFDMWLGGLGRVEDR